MAVVRIPGPLRRHVGDQQKVQVDGSTLSEVVQGLVKAHPDLAQHILDDEGKVQPFIHVFVRGQPAPDTSVEVGSEDEVLILPSVAGGC